MKQEDFYSKLIYVGWFLILSSSSQFEKKIENLTKKRGAMSLQKSLLSPWPAPIQTDTEPIDRINFWGHDREAEIEIPSNFVLTTSDSSSIFGLCHTISPEKNRCPQEAVRKEFHLLMPESTACEPRVACSPSEMQCNKMQQECSNSKNKLQYIAIDLQWFEMTWKVFPMPHGWT